MKIKGALQGLKGPTWSIYGKLEIISFWNPPRVSWLLEQQYFHENQKDPDCEFMGILNFFFF